MSRHISRPRQSRELLLSIGQHCALESLTEPDAWVQAARWAWDEVLARTPPRPARALRRLTHG